MAYKKNKVAKGQIEEMVFPPRKRDNDWYREWAQVASDQDGPEDYAFLQVDDESSKQRQQLELAQGLNKQIAALKDEIKMLRKSTERLD